MMVRVTGLEPARLRHQNLNLARLPFRHTRRKNRRPRKTRSGARRHGLSITAPSSFVNLQSAFSVL